MAVAASLFRRSIAHSRARAFRLWIASALKSLLLRACFARLCASFPSRFIRRAFSRRSSGSSAVKYSPSSDNKTLDRTVIEDGPSRGGGMRLVLDTLRPCSGIVRVLTVDLVGTYKPRVSGMLCDDDA